MTFFNATMLAVIPVYFLAAHVVMSSELFISLDGIDGVGKSTQIVRLSDHLRGLGHDVVTVRDPGSTEVGARVRSILLDSNLTMHRRTEAMLFMASRVEMIDKVIAPALAAGKTVISDRFLLSTVVYQSVGQTGTSPEWLWRMGQLANGELSPALTLLLDMPAAESMRRIEGPRDRMESRGVDYMESVRAAFRDQLPHTGGAGKVIDAAQSPDDVAAQVIAATEAWLAKR